MLLRSGVPHMNTLRCLCGNASCTQPASQDQYPGEDLQKLGARHGTASDDVPDTSQMVQFQRLLRASDVHNPFQTGSSNESLLPIMQDWTPMAEHKTRRSRV